MKIGNASFASCLWDVYHHTSIYQPNEPKFTGFHLSGAPDSSPRMSSLQSPAVWAARPVATARRVQKELHVGLSADQVLRCIKDIDVKSMLLSTTWTVVVKRNNDLCYDGSCQIKLGSRWSRSQITGVLHFRPGSHILIYEHNCWNWTKGLPSNCGLSEWHQHW